MSGDHNEFDSMSFKRLEPPEPIDKQIQDLLNQAVDRETRRRLKMIEQKVEEMITSDVQAGVLVLENFLNFEFKVILSNQVPFGEIYIVKDEELYDRFSPSATGSVSSSEESSGTT